MKISIVETEANAQGGESLNALRLAVVLGEQGHQVTFVHWRGSFPAGFVPDTVEVRSAPSREGVGDALPASDVLIAVGAGWDVVGQLDLDVPTIYFASTWSGVCPAGNRYWSRFDRVCTVQAGWKCAVLQPLCGCTDIGSSVELGRITTDARRRDRLARPRAAVAVHGPWARELYDRVGVPAGRQLVVPPLPLRMDPSAIEHLVPRGSAGVAPLLFVGRLTKQKGAGLLPELRRLLPPRVPLAVIGDGYLQSRLGPALAGEMLGSVSQEGVVRAMLGARGLVFPSLWPEPGGIAGVDALLFGLPVGAFAVGAATAWPAPAELFEPGDSRALAAWAAALDPGRVADPVRIAARQATYWDRVGKSASAQISSFVDSGEVSPSIDGTTVLRGVMEEVPHA